MKRLALTTALLLGLVFLAQSQPSNAAMRCGTFENEGTWYVTAAKMPCDGARFVAKAYMRRQIRTDWASWRVYLHPWRCYAGASQPGYCVRREGGKAGLWLTNYRHPDAERFRVIPPRMYSGGLYSRRTVRDKLGVRWRDGNGRRERCRNTSRLTERCRITWSIGDSGYRASIRARLWPTVGKWGVVSTRGTISRVNWYCLGVLKRSAAACTTKIGVGPRRFRL